MLFAAGDGVHGWELWKLDAATHSPTLVADLRPGPQSSWPGAFVRSGIGVVFTADDASGRTRLWKLDDVHGTSSGRISGTAIASAAAIIVAK